LPAINFWLAEEFPANPVAPMFKGTADANTDSFAKRTTQRIAPSGLRFRHGCLTEKIDPRSVNEPTAR
jgi:hypothetical protein